MCQVFTSGPLVLILGLHVTTLTNEHIIMTHGLAFTHQVEFSNPEKLERSNQDTRMYKAHN